MRLLLIGIILTTTFLPTFCQEYEGDLLLQYLNQSHTSDKFKKISSHFGMIGKDSVLHSRSQSISLIGNPVNTIIIRAINKEGQSEFSGKLPAGLSFGMQKFEIQSHLGSTSWMEDLNSNKFYPSTYFYMDKDIKITCKYNEDGYITEMVIQKEDYPVIYSKMRGRGITPRVSVEDYVYYVKSSRYKAGPGLPVVIPTTFVDQLNLVLEEYPKDFRELRGFLKQNASTNAEWISKVKMEGSYNSNIIDNNGYTMFEADFGDFATFEEAEKRYKELVEKIRYATLPCCNFVAKEHKRSDGKVTTWVVTDTRHKFNRMSIQVRLVSLENHELSLRVYDKTMEAFLAGN